MNSIKIGIVLLLTFCLKDLAFGQLAAGTYTVGNSGSENYASLTDNGGLFQEINTNGLSGDIIVLIATNLPAETGTYALNQWSGSYTVTIQPLDATIKTITYSGSCLEPLIDINGADNFIIDGSMGGSGRYLEFISACANRPVVRYKGDCLNNVLTGCILRSDNTDNSIDNGAIVNVTSTQVSGCDSLLISNCLLTDFSGISDVFMAMQISEPSIGNLDGLIITGNEFYNISGKGVHILEQIGTGKVEAVEVTRNHFYNDQPITGPGAGWVLAAIEFESGMGHIIRGNYIGGQLAFCGGGHAQIDLTNNQTIEVSLIRILGTVESPTPMASQDIIQIDSNVFRNINIETGTVISHVSFIRLDGGHCNVGSVYPNFIGDATSDAMLAPSIEYVNNYNYTGVLEENLVRLVQNESPGLVRIENNQLGSLSFKSNLSTGKVSVNLLYSNATSATSNVIIKANQVGGVSNNIYKGCNDYFRALYSYNDNGQLLIRDNVFSGITTGDYHSTGSRIIQCWNGNASTSIVNNTITNMLVGSGTQNSFLEAIVLNRPGANIDSNSISNITINSALSGTHFTGIFAICNSGTTGISYNHITDVFVENTSTSATAGLYGIFMTGSSNYLLRCNFISTLSSLNGSTASSIRGIMHNATGTNNFINNVILLENGSNTNNLLIFGIVDYSASGINNYSHNTIAIKGKNMSGAQGSACYYSSTTGVTRNIRNNLFSNQRTGGATGHYTLFFAGPGGSILSNYNLLYSEESSARVVWYGGFLSFVGWQATGFDANGITGLAPQDLVDFSTGEQLTTLGNDIAGSGLGITYDHIFTARPLGAGFDMGAFEKITLDLGSPLPVELITFEATCSASEITLHWLTKSEIQNDYFIVEVSSDGVNWTAISEVDGAGNSSEEIHYYASYKTQQSGVQYFRLTQVDYDGKSRIYNAVSANCIESECTEFSYQLNENNLTLLVKNECLGPETVVSVYDGQGRLIRSEQINTESDTYSISTQGMSGFYIVHLDNGYTRRSLKLVL